MKISAVLAAVAVLLLLATGELPPSAPPATAAPISDSFSTPAVVGEVPFTYTTDTATATLQPSEPQPCPTDIGKTVWLSFAPAASGTYLLDTVASGFDTMLAVHTGSAINQLTPITCNDDWLSTNRSRIALNATAGVTYRIQAGGYNGAGGNLALSIVKAPAAPPNNTFAASLAVASVPFADMQYNYAATEDVDEDRTTCSDVERTVWYTFTPPTSGNYQIDTLGSDLDTVLTVYTGATLLSLNQAGCNDDALLQPDVVTQSRVVMALTAGTLYRIQAGGFSGFQGGAQADYGRLVFNIRVPLAGDTDADGCTDAQEGGPAPASGGGRSPYDPFDFFDVTEDRAVDLADTLQVLTHFGHAKGADAFDALVDRYSPNPALPYRTAAAISSNFGVDLSDVVTTLQSFGHSCVATPTPTPTPLAATATSTRTPTRTPTAAASTATTTRTPTPTQTAAACLDTDGDTQCNTVDLDDDGDGCADTRELGADPLFGGDRDPLYFWDFFDVTGDRTIDLNDVINVLQYFGVPPTDPAANLRDRWTPDPDKPWRSAEANDGIDLRDTLALLKAYAHDCNG